MATVIPGQPGLGYYVGTGISEALDQLTARKMKELNRKETARGLQALGYQPQEALQLAHLDPTILREAIKQKGKQAETARFGEALSLLSGGGQQPQGVEQQLLQVLQQQPQKQPQQQQIQQPDFSRLQTPESNLKNVLSSAGLFPGSPQIAAPQQQQVAQQPIVEPTSQLSNTAQQLKQALPELRTITPQDVARIARQTKLSPQQYKDLNQIARENQKAELATRKQQFLESKEEKKAEREQAKERRIEQRDLDKETKPVYDEIVKSGKSAKENDRRLDRIEVINEKGNLGSPLANSLVKTLSHGIFGFGIDLSALLTADAQELDKISSDFVKSAKGFFGTRLTDADLKVFMQTIPTLLQSKDGRTKVVRNLRIANQVDQLRLKALKDIIKENGNVRPKHLDILVDERIESQLDSLANEFKTGFLGTEQLKPTGTFENIGRALGLYY